MSQSKCICIKSCIELNDGRHLFESGKQYKYEVVSHYIMPEIWEVTAFGGAVVIFYEEPQTKEGMIIKEYFVDIQQLREIKLDKLI